MTKEIDKQKQDLTMILFAQTVAGARNVKPIIRLEAMHDDLAAIIRGEKPTASWEITK